MLFGSGPGAMLFADDWAEWERPDGFCLWTMEYAAQLRGKPQWKEFFCHLQEQIICGPIQKNGMRRNAALLALVSNARAQSMTCLFTGLMTCAVTCHSDTHKWCGVSRTVSLMRVHSWLTQTLQDLLYLAERKKPIHVTVWTMETRHIVVFLVVSAITGCFGSSLLKVSPGIFQLASLATDPAPS